MPLYDSRFALLATLLPLGVLACRAPAPPPPTPALTPPPVEVRAEQFVGSPLSGALDAEAGDAANASFFAAGLHYLEDLPVRTGQPLASRADIVANVTGETPILPVAGLVAESFILTGEAAAEFLLKLRSQRAGRSVTLSQERVALLPNTTFALEAVGSERVRDPLDWLGEFEGRGPIEKRVGLHLAYAGEAGCEVAVVVQDLDPWIEAARIERFEEETQLLPEPPEPASKEILRREFLRLDQLWHPAEGPLVLILPTPFRSGNGAAFACALEPCMPEVELDSGALSRARHSVQRAAERIAAPPPTAETGRDLERSQALIAFLEQRQRPALLMLAAEAGAALAEDFALVAPSAWLEEYATRLVGEDVPADLARDPEEVALRLEGEAFRLLAARALAENLSAEGNALLLRHAGELGRFPDVIEDAVAASTTLDALRLRLADENRVFLEDTGAAARLRAHEWLVARGLGVEGFEPLAGRSERRAALEAWRLASATATAATATAAAAANTTANTGGDQ